VWFATARVISVFGAYWAAHGLNGRIESRLLDCVVDANANLRKAALQFDGAIFSALPGGELGLENSVDLNGVTRLRQFDISSRHYSSSSLVDLQSQGYVESVRSDKPATSKSEG